MKQEISGWVEGGALAKALGTVMTRRVGSIVVVSDGVSFRQFDFGVTYLRATSLGPRRTISIVEAIRALNLVSEEELAGLEHFAQGNEEQVALLALKHGFLTREQYDEALRHQLTELLLDVYVWRGAEVRLICDEPPEELKAEGFLPGRLETPVYSFLSRTRVRVEEFRDERNRLPTGREVYERVPGAKAPEKLSLTKWEKLLVRLDGSRTVQRAIDESRVCAAPAYRFIQKALAAGVIRKSATRKAREIARAHLEAEINELEEILPRSPAPATVRLRLARAYETVGAPMPAAEHWKLLGRYWRRRGAHDKALEYYRNCVRLVPNDLAAREVIVEIHRASGNDRELIADGRPLAEMLFKYNLLKRATVLLMQLIEVQKHDEGLRRQLIQVLLGLGARSLALKHLKILAHELETQDAPPQVLRDVYLQIGGLDHADTRYRARLDRLYGVQAQKRTMWISAAGAAAVVLMAFTWFRFEFGARLDVQAAVDQARQYMIDGDFERADRTLAVALDASGWSSGASKAHELWAANRGYIETIAANERAAQSKRDPEAQARRDASATIARQAATQLADGDRPGAHRLFRVLAEESPWSDALATADVPLDVRTTPADATILLDGEPVGTGSADLVYAPGKRSVLRVERPGFEAQEFELSSVRDAELPVKLDRTILWRHRLSAAIDASPLPTAGELWVAGRDGRLVGFDAVTGEVRASRSIGPYSDLSRSPVGTPQGVVVVTSAGRAVHVNDGGGKIGWEWPTLDPRQPVALADGRVVVPSGDGSMAALEASTGDVSWMAPPGTVASGSPTALPDGRLAFVNQARTLAVVEPEEGKIAWLGDASLGLVDTPATDRARAYALTEGGRLRIVDTTSGALVGDVQLPHRPRFAPVAAEGGVYLVAHDGHVLAFDDTGKPRFEPVQLDQPPSAPPAVNGGRLYVPGESGRLTVLDARSGELLWTQDAGARITAPPTFGYQTAYVVTDAGEVIAMTN